MSITKLMEGLPNQSMAQAEFDRATGKLMAELPQWGNEANALAADVNTRQAATAASAAAAAGSRDAALAYRDQAEAARDVANGYRDETQTARDVSQGYRNQAQASATAAAASAAAAGSSTIATSTSSVAVGNGTKVFAVPAGKQFAVDQPVVAASGTNRMFGTVVSYSGTTLTLAITFTEGAGTFASWTISPSGAPGVPGGIAGGNLVGALNERRAAGVELPWPGNHTPEIWAGTGNFIRTFGGGGIIGFTNAPQQGAARTLLIGDPCSITASANLVVRGVPSGTTIPLAAGDELDVRAELTTLHRVTVHKADGMPVAGGVVPQNARRILTSGAYVARKTGWHRMTLFGAPGRPGIASQVNDGDIPCRVTGAGSGAVCIDWQYLVAGQSYMVTLGAPATSISQGLAGNQLIQGVAGGDTIFYGTRTITAGGGQGGRASVLSTADLLGGEGGVASGGKFNYTGGAGGDVVGPGRGQAATGGGNVPILGTGYKAGNASCVPSNQGAASGGSGIGGVSGAALLTQPAGMLALSGGGGAGGPSPDVVHAGSGSMYGAGSNNAEGELQGGVAPFPPVSLSFLNATAGGIAANASLTLYRPGSGQPGLLLSSGRTVINLQLLGGGGGGVRTSGAEAANVVLSASSLPVGGHGGVALRTGAGGNSVDFVGTPGVMYIED